MYIKSLGGNKAEMFIRRMTKKTLNEFEEINWNPIYKKNNMVILTKYAPHTKKSVYMKDLIEPFETLGSGIWSIILGIVLIILSPFQLIGTILGFIPKIFIIEEDNKDNESGDKK